ncbi:hypothetical protein [Dyella japonica]|uniref:Uncharacterized protein n=1 Tax=Dyella japonica TaxID=231455 RepID=A0ABV2JYN2_9GAMM
MPAITIYPMATLTEDGTERRLAALVTRVRYERERAETLARGEPWLWWLVEEEGADVSELDLVDGFFLFPDPV